MSFLPAHEDIFLKAMGLYVRLQWQSTRLGFLKKLSTSAFLFANSLSKIEREVENPIVDLKVYVEDHFLTCSESLLMVPSSALRNI
jgi:hypothetical protein